MAECVPSARPSVLSAFTALFSELDLADDLALDVRLEPGARRVEVRVRAAAGRVATHRLVASGVRRVSYVPYEGLVIEEEYGELFPFPRICEYFAQRLEVSDVCVLATEPVVEQVADDEHQVRTLEPLSERECEPLHVDMIRGIEVGVSHDDGALGTHLELDPEAHP